MSVGTRGLRAGPPQHPTPHRVRTQRVARHGATPKSAREGNDFSWGPIAEVGKLFAGIFITIATSA